jgi:hypothetical protein
MAAISFFGAGTNVACLKLGRPFRALPFVKKRAKIAAVRLNNSYFIKLLRFLGNKNPPAECSAGGLDDCRHDRGNSPVHPKISE